MTRRRISASERLRIWEAAEGVCHICGARIDGTRERWDVEHVIPLAQGGDDHGDNLRPAHASCHRAKTADDATATAKTKRMRQRQVGIKRTVRAVIPGSKDSGWKRKIDGTVVPRGRK